MANNTFDSCSTQEFLSRCHRCAESWSQQPNVDSAELAINMDRIKKLEERFLLLDSRLNCLESTWKNDNNLSKIAVNSNNDNNTLKNDSSLPKIAAVNDNNTWKNDSSMSKVAAVNEGEENFREERMKLLTMLMRAEVLIGNLMLENQNMRAQIESSCVQKKIPAATNVHAPRPRTETSVADAPQYPRDKDHYLKRRHQTEPEMRTSKHPKIAPELKKVQVQYPTGYDPQQRRFCVSSESYDPQQIREVNIKRIPKSDEVRATIRQTVQGNVLFKHLDEVELEEVVDSMDELKLEPNKVVIKQGAFVDEHHMYLIESGELEVLYGNDVVATLSTGCAFGEIALMYGCPRTATIRTKTTCVLWTLDRHTFRRILMEESMRRRKLYESVLAKVPIFKILLPYERSKVADALEAVTFNDKDVIIQQGSTDANKFYIIEKGEVVCTKQDNPDGPAVFSLRLKAGDYFGELALLKNEPRQATVTAHGLVKCLTIDREHFNQVTGPCEEILRRNMSSYKSYEELVAALEVSVSPRQVTEPDVYIECDLPANREEIIRYIVQNEAEYVFNLTQTQGYFEALSEHAAEVKVTKQQLTTIFGNVNEIADKHSQFNSLLSTMSVEYEDDPDLGELYSQFAPSLSLYEVFVRDFQNSLQVRQACAQHTEFSDFLMACHKEAGESLDALLEQIYLRVFQLVVLLQHLLDATDTLHSDKNSLAVALRKIKTQSMKLKQIKGSSVK